MFHKRSSSLLEVEALNYFKLDDPAQVHSFGQSAASNGSPGKSQNSNKDRKSARPKAAQQKSNLGAMHLSHRDQLASSRKYRNECANRLSNDRTKMKPNQRSKLTNNKPPPISINRSDEPTVLAVSPFLASSSTNSTNSLPSISSSPSVSPSLVCPHISLDDILSLRNDSKSAHTIGLCAKCRLNPPVDVQSPLSPSFKPSSSCQEPKPKSTQDLQRIKIRRGYSDQHMKSRGSSKSNEAPAARRSPRLSQKTQDDSLDHCLDLGDLKRLQMSPMLRHSVEFIRNNETEAGRVVVIHKNGQPYDKPLRICIMRDQFATLNHLLDHINTRQLVPSGARYLFHMDGQLVYSVNELKHGSTYIVSGVRNFDFNANSILREQYHVRQEPQQDATSRRSRAELPNPVQQNVEFKSHPSQPKVQLKTQPTASVAEPSARRSSSSQTRTEGITVKRNENKLGSSRTLDRNKPHYSRTSLGHQDDDTVFTSKSQENLTATRPVVEKPVILTRAKSELGEGIKRKKNVTFLDTGRGASPAVSEHKGGFSEKALQDSDGDLSTSVPLSASEANLKEALSTNEIGIQVSDSIEGFLIDLPMAMPVSKASKSPERRTYLRKGQGVRASQGATFASRKTQPFGISPKRTEQTGKVAMKRRVVTITERQLSLDEMNQLKDLNIGDHHHDNRARPIIKLDHVEDPPPESPDERPAEKPKQDPPPQRKSSVTSTEVTGDAKAEGAHETQWQYPGGRQASASPSQRSVSQCEPNEAVHARVTTPTPSLSTGDNISLTMSYDAGGVAGLQRSDSRQDHIDLPAKQRLPVRGHLCAGLDPPERTFSLDWVNGFIINDLFPENSNLRLPISDARPSQSISETALLSPSEIDRTTSVFRPSDRFNNWICHSQRHDELVYPVGSLIVLWCRWTNEQRYYSRHTSSVSSLSLASLDNDLAASAQIADQIEHTNASVHLWSLGTLETLQIIDDDLFCSRRIFSLKVKHDKSEGCEVSLAAKDEKHLWLYALKLDISSAAAENDNKTTKVGVKPSSISVIKADKLMHANQLPLLVNRLSIQKLEGSTPTKNQPNLDIILSFGRRHFQLWLVDLKQRKLRLMQAESKTSRFIDSILKANCLIRLGPSEFLVGDADGNITLLILNLRAQSESKAIFSSPERETQKYEIETVSLHFPKVDEGPIDLAKRLPPTKPPSITCLARVSGNLFASGDSNCVIKFWRIERGRGASVEATESGTKTDLSGMSPSCRQVSCIKLPPDLGFICAIIVSRYNRKQSIVDFYVVSTSNAILFGSIQLQVGDDHNVDVLANSSLSVVYEGHETSALNLVSDRLNFNPKLRSMSPTGEAADYFTCSIDCKICKWSGKSLVWKSMLPSACSSLAVHPVGFVLAVGAADGTVYILDKYSGLLISYFPLTPVCINCLAYSRDGVLLAAGCANGSIFILPVYENGLKYKKVSIFQSPYPVVSLQFSLDNQFILTSVTHGSYQELILWDLPNFRYMRQGVKLAAEKIDWHDPICSGSEDVRAIWENANLSNAIRELPKARNLRRLTTSSLNSVGDLVGTAVNLSCHRLIRTRNQADQQYEESFVIASDTRGYLRLFRYPCYDIQQGFYEIRTGSFAINCCRFLASSGTEKNAKFAKFVSTSLDGSICLWRLD